MQQDALVEQLHSMLGIVLYMSLPPLVAAVVVGLVIGVLQAVTQIQDQSMPLTFKLLAVIAVVAFGGAMLTVPLLREAVTVFDNFPLMTR
ncbi:type III secretion protein S [Endobacter medicaginis]|uniref:Flagellar biosynthetic protein FliQ n=1 Tax=Endobacter medicaginis TaxID=1181271 RepID=A0A839V6T6_9PROT|nr:flagellar biosynthetic protein FliQ [Endobacter medicaginis]MBB3175272.1 type III secretion protein S [Endobacter medicaginis]MCX5476944.1 flagellar biosynthetic protein FliQ [Endobacter medicaginis]NVN29441.1 flagellar biosynthetic protein FliQ [Endobacter medicaginis]